MGDVIDLRTRKVIAAGNRLRELYCASGLTRSQLAGAIGVDVKTIRDWETGAARVPGEHEVLLARRFGCGVAYLMGVA
jgi:DNA-binding XRE family transcriptional regulator